MSFAGAASFVFFASLKNRVRRTLKQPRYLVFTALGLFYLWGVFARRTLPPPRAHAGLDVHPSPLVLLAVAAFALVYVTGVWVFGGDETALNFTEAEVQFFFTAPVTRRTLIQYRLVRILVTTALGGPLIALVTRRGGHLGYYAVGMWLALATLSLHRVCASLTRAMLAEHGLAGARRRVVTLAVIVGAVGAIGYACVHAIGRFPAISIEHLGDTFDALGAWAEENRRALSWVLFPVAAVYDVCVAQTPGQLLAALPGALAVLGAHYVWAMSSSVAFEESEAEAAIKRTKRLAGARSCAPLKRRGRPLFSLAPRGPAWVAIFWKNFIAGNRTMSRARVVILLVSFLGAPAVAIVASGVGSADLLFAIGVFVSVFALLAALMGPHVVRSDFRLDLAQIDILRSYPIAPFDVVRGEVLAPLVSLAVIEWVLVVAGATLTLDYYPGEYVALRVAGALSLALLLPAITLAGLVVRNAAVLLFPSWMATGEKGDRGIEVIGQRLFAMVATLLVVVVALVPAVIVGGGVGWALWGALGAGAVAIGGGLGAAVVFGLAYVSLVPLGWAFERFDVGQS